MNQPACRAVYQDVTGWGGRRRAVRAGSRMGIVNGNNGNAVEITPAGRQIATRTLIKNGAGDLFGVITTPAGVIAVNDGANVLELFRG